MPKSWTIGLLVSAGVLTILLFIAILVPGSRPQTQAAGAPPSIKLMGIVRDFRADHPDFGLTDVLGHYAGTVETSLGPGGRPALSGSGYAVASAWRDSSGRHIAPHLYATSAAAASLPGGVHVSETIRLTGDSMIDGNTIDADGHTVPGTTVVTTNATSSGAVEVAGGSIIDGDVMVGPGGNPASIITGSGLITGVRAALDAPHLMPTVEVPGDDEVGPNTGDVWFKHTPSTISSNMHVDDFRISTEAVVSVVGNIKIVVEGEFRTETKGVFKVLPGSSLDIYLTGPKFTVETRCLWSDPAHTRVWVVGSPQMKIQTNADFYGSIFAPNADLLVQTDASVHGSIVCRNLEGKTGGMIHGIGSAPAACSSPQDVAGTAGPGGSGGIASASSFDEWFRDVPGTNQSGSHPITLVGGTDGVFEFTTDAFHPADGRLLGNEGAAHNANFTYALSANFVYQDCGGQFLEFGGGDGAWVFVNDELVIDLGGVGAIDVQRIDLDRLGLTPGQSYQLRLFYAQRRAGAADFSLRTNIGLSSSMPTMIDVYD